MILWIAVRRLLALLIRLLLLNRVVSAGVFGLLIVGFVIGPFVAGLLSDGQTPTTAASPGQAQPAQMVARSDEPPAPAVQAYIKGMTTFDARLMWSTLSSDAASQMQSQIGSIEKYQEVLDEAKRRGARYEDVSYIGAYPLRNGSRYFFYVIGRRGFAAPDAYEQMYYVFTVGPDGKILRID